MNDARARPRRWHSGAASDATWARRFEALKAYRSNAGHFFIPRRHPDPELRAAGRWAGEQRVAYNRGELDPYRVERLQAIGFPFDYHAARWEALFAQLQRFRARYGDCHVPFRDARWGRLARWVQVQRQRYQSGTLPPAAAARLEALGFAWSLPRGRSSHATILRERPSVFLLKLERFRDLHGHVRVPPDYPASPDLPRLCELAGRYGRDGQLRDEAMLLLHQWGFDFAQPVGTPPPLAFIGGLAGFLESLKAFHEQHGHARVPVEAPPPWRELARACAVVRRLSAEEQGEIGEQTRRQLEALGFTCALPAAAAPTVDDGVIL